MRSDPYAIVLSAFILAAGLSMAITFISASGENIFEQPAFEELNFIEKMVFLYPTPILLLALGLLLFMFRLFNAM